MKRTSLAASSALFALLGVAPGLADVTPEQVWQNWQKLSAGYGQALVADSVARDGDTLVVTGMKLSMDQDGVKVDGSLEEVRFKDLGNGTVEVSMSDTYPLTMTTPAEAGGPETMSITISQPGLKMIAAGSATDTDYTFSAPTIGLTLQAKQADTTLADIKATMQGMSGLYKVIDKGQSSTLDSAFAAQSVTFTVDAKDEKGGTVAMKGDIAALKATSIGTFLSIDAMENMAQALRDGFSVSGDFSYGAGNFSIDAIEGDKPTKITASNESANLIIGMSQKGLRYAAGGKGVVVAISGADIPFPELKLSYGEAGFDLLMPLTKSDTPADFSFVTRIVDLAVSDELWAMLDPTAALPRDPATLIIETKGTAQLNVDILDEAAMSTLGEAAPGTINSLELTNLSAKMVGVDLSGTGAATFDNTDLATFDGIPAPTGKIDLVLKGGNRLLDKLVSMGLIPEQDAMGARMMFAMLAKPGEGDDVLNSTLEFKDKGFFANGQRLQ